MRFLKRWKRWGKKREVTANPERFCNSIIIKKKERRKELEAFPTENGTDCNTEGKSLTKKNLFTVFLTFSSSTFIRLMNT